MALSKGAVQELLLCCKGSASSAQEHQLREHALLAVRALTSVLATQDARDQFLKQDGITVMRALLEESSGQPLPAQHAVQYMPIFLIVRDTTHMITHCLDCCPAFQ